MDNQCEESMSTHPDELFWRAVRRLVSDDPNTATLGNYTGEIGCFRSDVRGSAQKLQDDKTLSPAEAERLKESRPWMGKDSPAQATFAEQFALLINHQDLYGLKIDNKVEVDSKVIITIVCTGDVSRVVTDPKLRRR